MVALLFLLASVSTATPATTPGARASECAGLVWCEALERFAYHPLEEAGGEGSTGHLSAVITQLADTDQNSRISFQEFQSFMKLYLHQAFSVVDANIDGIVSEREAVAMVTGMNFTTVEKVVRGVFEVMDLDGDGALSTKDIPQASRERLDTNNDGKVALKELLGHDIIFFPRPVQSVYRVLDSNKDEVVSMTEATNFINFLGRLFNILDANSNCMVTLDEALEALDAAQLPKDFQLALELWVRPYTSLGRYLALTTIELAGGAGGLSLNQLLDFRSDTFIDDTRAVALPVYMSLSSSPFSFLTGGTSLAGAAPGSPEEAARWSNTALAAWLATAQGFLGHPSFSLPPPSCT